MSDPKETRSYICPARWGYRGNVIIEASSPEEAQSVRPDWKRS